MTGREARCFSIPCPVLEESEGEAHEHDEQQGGGEGRHQSGGVERSAGYDEVVVVVALVEFIDDVGVVDDQTEVELARSRNGVRPDDGFGAVGQGASGEVSGFHDRPIDV